MEVEPEKSVKNTGLSGIFHSRARNIQKNENFKIKQFQCNIALTAKGEKHEKIKKDRHFSDTPQIVSRKLMFENV